MSEPRPDHHAEASPIGNSRRDRAAAGPPRWVKVSLIVGVAVLLLFVIGKLTGVGGDHGPGRHGDEPGVVNQDNGSHQPPAGHSP